MQYDDIISIQATEEEEDSMEAWETVTPEKEQWVRLLHHLDTLALLSTVVGQKAMGELPPILFVFCGEGEADAEEPDVSDLQVQLLNKGESSCSQESRLFPLSFWSPIIRLINPALLQGKSHCL